MNPNILKGCGTALVTPFRNGEVDYDAYAHMVRRQVDNGIHFLVALGSTAETPCLNDEEKVRLLRLTRENAPGKVIVAGVGTNSVHGTLHNMELLKEADMYLVVVPYYNKPTQNGLFQYFKLLAEKSERPIILYNVPGRTGTNMAAHTTIKLSQLPNIVGIKEASGNIEQIRSIIDGVPKDFSIFSGNDDQTVEIILEGGHGVISVASNAAPARMVKMVDAALKGDFRHASKLFRLLLPLFDACFVESNPIPIKAGMSVLGLCENEMRLPLTTSETSTCNLMQEVLTKLDVKS